MRSDPKSEEVEEKAAVLSAVDSTVERTKRDLPRRKSLALLENRLLAFCPGMTALLGLNGQLKMSVVSGPWSVVSGPWSVAKAAGLEPADSRH
jgi:hypothetical protein